MSRRIVCIGTRASGSYGLAGPPGGVIRVWLCGGMEERNGVVQDPCAHTSRREARECPYRGGGVRPEYQQTTDRSGRTRAWR